MRLPECPPGDGSTRFPARVHTLENGLRVGIVGIVTDYVNIWERPEHLSGITIEDPLPAAASALAALKGNVDLTVCVYHGGFERDLSSGRTAFGYERERRIPDLPGAGFRYSPDRPPAYVRARADGARVPLLSNLLTRGRNF